MQSHRPMVAVKVGLALCAVYDESVHLAEAASDLEGCGEHSAAHTHYARFTQTCEYGFGVFQLFFSERSHIGAGGILVVVFDYDCHDHIAQRMGPGLNCYDLA